MRFVTTLVIAMMLILSACDTDATVASANLSKDAEMFRIERRIVFYNAIRDVWIFQVTGRCSISDSGTQLEVTCKLGEEKFVKHFLGDSDNVTYFAEQIEASDTNVLRYNVVFKPKVIVPTVELSN